VAVPLHNPTPAKSLFLNDPTGTICRPKTCLWNGTGTRNVPLERSGTASAQAIEKKEETLERSPFRSGKLHTTVPLPPFLKGEGGVRREDASQTINEEKL